MRIALVTEHFAPSSASSAHVTGEVVTRLTETGHDLVVFAGGRGRATFRGARLFWASRMTPVSAIREALVLSRPDVCHLLDPRRLGLKVAEAADRLGVPALTLHPRVWRPGVDLTEHHPGLRDPDLHEALVSGVPVVAYDSGTSADVVRHEHNGLLAGTESAARASSGAWHGCPPAPTCASPWPRRHARPSSSGPGTTR